MIVITIIIRVLIKHFASTKSNIFFNYGHVKEILFYYFCDTKLCVNMKKDACISFICWNHVCEVNEWFLV